MKQQETIRTVLWVLLPLTLAIIFDVLFYSRQPGISFPLFHLLTIGSFLILFKPAIKKGRTIAWITLGFSHLLSWSFALFISVPVLFFNALLVPFLSIIGLWMLTHQEVQRWKLPSFVYEFVRSHIFPFLKGLVKPIDFVRSLLPNSKKVSGRWKDILIGLILFSPVFLFALFLLASADTVFSSFIESLFDFNIPHYYAFEEHAFFILVFYVLFSAVAWAIYKSNGLTHTLKESTIKPKHDVMMTGLVMMNLLYLVFLIIQFRYLFGGADLSFLENLTYAEYARKGFYELLIVSGLNLGIIAVIRSFAKGPIYTNYLRGGLTILNLSSLILLGSAAQRLILYIQAYGLTHIRFFSGATMIAIFFYLSFTLIALYKRSFSSYQASLVASALLWVLISFCNVDAQIAKYNLSANLKTDSHDLAYLLNGLSIDAFPTVITLLEERAPQLRERHQGYQYRGDETLMLTNPDQEIPLYFDYNEKIESWPEWNWSRQQREQLLKRLR